MTIDRWEVDLIRSAKTRASLKNLEFSITPEYIRSLFEASGGKCQLTGIPFDFDKSYVPYERRPYVPSIDRINPSAGYTEGNVRLICSAVNIAMNTWGMPVLMRIATALIDGAPESKRRPHLLTRRRNSKKYGVRWEAFIRKNGVQHNLGTFSTIAEAHRAYDIFVA